MSKASELREMRNQIRENIKSANEYTATQDEIDNINRISENFLEKPTDEHVPPHYNYTPTLTVIYSDGTVEDLTNNLNFIQMNMDFTKYVFPLFSIQLFIESRKIPKIQFDDNAKYTFELLYKSNTEDVPFLYDKIFSVNLSKIKQINSPINVEEEVYVDNNYFDRRNLLELKLIPTECLNANKFLFSGVYNNCNILDVIALMSNKLPNKVFIQQPDNVRKYNQIIFIPYNVFYSLQYLDNYYGIYDRGLKLFYGFDIFRIQSSNWFDELGTNKVKVNFSNESDTMDFSAYNKCGLIRHETDNFISITPDLIKIVDKRHYIKEVIGNNMTSFSREADTIDAQMRNYRVTDIDDNDIKTKTYVNNLNNVNKEKELYNKTIHTKTLELNLPNIILDVQSWFKAFEINFDSSYYNSFNGQYTMTNYVFKLSALNNSVGSGFSNNSVIVLDEV